MDVIAHMAMEERFLYPLVAKEEDELAKAVQSQGS
jgi:hypothetical protein